MDFQIRKSTPFTFWRVVFSIKTYSPNSKRFKPVENTDSTSNVSSNSTLKSKNNYTTNVSQVHTAHATRKVNDEQVKAPLVAAKQ